MPQTYTALRMHLVWSTRQRRPWLDPEWRGRLFAVASGLAAGCRTRILCAGGVRDHWHLYVELAATAALADLVAALKTGTARWVRSTFPHRANFGWQDGWAAFTVASTDDAWLLDFIRHQDVSHRDRDFTTEYLGLLERHGVAYDLRDIWE
jgi:REP element-mobilizing transposase RayT